MLLSQNKHWFLSCAQDDVLIHGANIFNDPQLDLRGGGMAPAPSWQNLPAISLPSRFNLSNIPMPMESGPSWLAPIAELLVDADGPDTATGGGGGGAVAPPAPVVPLAAPLIAAAPPFLEVRTAMMYPPCSTMTMTMTMSQPRP